MKRLEYIREVANGFIEQIKPYCLRAEIAGSIRREELEPNDIEICAVPVDLHGLKDIMDRQDYIKGKFPSKYSRIKYHGEHIDIFWCSRENWGNIFLIRTGEWRFSKWIMGTKTREVGLRQREGYLWRGDERLNCFEEIDVFNLLGMRFIKPKNRIGI